MTSRLPRAVAGYAAALILVVATSVIIGGILGVATVGNLPILYLLPILVSATRLGRGPAIFSSLAAFLIYDWFFVEPIHYVTIADPAEWVALLLFLFTAIITSQLAANVRARAEQSERREREARLLFDAVRLMSDDDLGRALAAVAERLRAQMRVSGVAIALRVGERDHNATAGQIDASVASTDVLTSGKRPTATEAGGPARWIRVVPPGRRAGYEMAGDRRRYSVPIQSEGTTVGHLTLMRSVAEGPFTAPENRSLALVAGLLASLAQRTELHDATTRAEVLRRTDELKSALLAAVSHDLRTPLASIIASSGSLRQPDVQWTDAERREFVADIESEARRLSRIVDNLLDLSRMESGALRPDRGWYDIGALIDDVLGRLRPLTVGRAIKTNVPDDLPPVPLDYVEIDQVLSNLIENAVRHTPDGTPITVSARVERDVLAVEVADDGPGIDARALPYLFDAFFRGAPRGRPGTGLGLAVARGLVEAHGGTITAANRPTGGAAFRFTLPLQVDRAAAPVPT